MRTVSSPQPPSPGRGDARAVFDTAGIDLRSTLRFVSLLRGDPTSRLGSASFERATLTPLGPASLRVSWTGDTAHLDAWGEGAAWIVERGSALLGLHDDPSGFVPTHSALRTVWEQNQGLRVHRTGTLWHDLAWFVLQQRVRFVDAANGWRDLVMAFGEDAPGPIELRLPPRPEVVAALGYHDLHPMGIERSRADTLIRAAREMPRAAHGVDDAFDAVRPRLAAIRGIGPWTLAGLESLTWGSADAVIVGDVGLPPLLCWFLARESWGDDARMIELLEPYRPHRYRVIQMAFASGVSPPRRRPTRYGVNDMRRR